MVDIIRTGQFISDNKYVRPTAILKLCRLNEDSKCIIHFESSVTTILINIFYLI